MQASPLQQMHRWLLNTFAALSLLLMLAVVTLWVRSNWRSDVMFHSHPKGVIGFGSATDSLVIWRGRINQISVFNERYGTRFESRAAARSDDFKPIRLPLRWEFSAFACKGGPAYQADWNQLRMPFWPCFRR